MSKSWKEVKIGNSSLVLHCGGIQATLEELTAVPVPPATKTWMPIPHRALIDQVSETLGRTGLSIKESAFAMYGGGQRFFGLLGLDIRGGDGDYQVVVGLCNSHDQSFPVGMVVGSRVFACDNLAFSSEIQVTRKHTNRLMDDLPRLVVTAWAKIGHSAIIQDLRFDHYKGIRVTDAQAHDIIVQAVDVGSIGCTAIPRILEDWRARESERFPDPTGWKLYNAFTAEMKGATLPRRSIALQGLLDLATRFDAAKLQEEAAEAAIQAKADALGIAI